MSRSSSLNGARKACLGLSDRIAEIVLKLHPSKRVADRFLGPARSGFTQARFPYEAMSTRIPRSPKSRSAKVFLGAAISRNKLLRAKCLWPSCSASSAHTPRHPLDSLAERKDRRGGTLVRMVVLFLDLLSDRLHGGVQRRQENRFVKCLFRRMSPKGRCSGLKYTESRNCEASMRAKK